MIKFSRDLLHTVWYVQYVCNCTSNFGNLTHSDIWKVDCKNVVAITNNNVKKYDFYPNTLNNFNSKT